MSRDTRSRSPPRRPSHRDRYNYRSSKFYDRYDDRRSSNYGHQSRSDYHRSHSIRRNNREDSWKHDRYNYDDKNERRSETTLPSRSSHPSRYNATSTLEDSSRRPNYVTASEKNSEERKEQERLPRRSRFDQPAKTERPPPPPSAETNDSSEFIPTINKPRVSDEDKKPEDKVSASPTNPPLDPKIQTRLEKVRAWKESKAAQSVNKKDSTAAIKPPHNLLQTDKNAMPSKGISGFELGRLNNNNKEPKRINRVHMDDDDAPRRLNLQDYEDLWDKEDREGIQASSNPTAMDEDEVDPLDAYMESLVGSTDTVRPGLLNTEVIDSHANEDERTIKSETLEEEENLLALAAKRSKKKDVISVDHSKMNYEDFRKDFYVEPEELKHLTPREVDELRASLEGIKVRGIDCPKPVTSWSQCGLSAQTMDVIRGLGYGNPTSIQSQAIPAISSGRDVIGVAKTGSGKTIAFLLPMFRHIRDQRPLRNGEGPIGIIMTPTRELAVQIHRECKPFAKALNLRAVCAYGGAPIKDQIAELKRGAEIVVCTPGRMIDVLSANQGRVTNLHRCTYLVLDEADRMFDLGFEPQVMRIINNVRPNRQTVLFSATFPRAMEALARKVLKKPIEITVGGRSVVASEVEQIVEVRSEESKFMRLLELLGELYNTKADVRTLVFVDRQEAADALFADLMKRGYTSNSIHGGKEQNDRDSTISDFKAGVFDVLIATSVAARGLDVKSLQLVVNYDCPNHMEDYVHRVGRTGRAGHTGVAVTFITPDQEKYAVDIAKALQLSKQHVPDELRKLAQQFLEKVKAGKEKAAGGGYGGKGLSRLDETRNAERKMQRKAYGEDVEEEQVEEEHAPLEKLPAEKSTGDFTLDRVRAAIGGITARALSGQNGQANKLTQPISIIKSDTDEFKAKMEINDYPQQARWAVTNNANIMHVTELTGTSITTRGNFYLPGKNPEAGEEKLYLWIEGPSELVVSQAVTELKRLLLEGVEHSLEGSSKAAPTGRYTVV
ncbi:ATP-dependent RNA helicase Prp11 [Schizosaccharomyces cryophilus OY26]|uniref:RNA helicase n=1 Tax=Schizosaccharomyces cryophilus (strain OY26 / ATCC MYA-4695 / CBS 11777 / NBRC 106824 / NRRL Y48691) TaxID=653667 RepID=S9VPS1_SCHCR|nr:ATP-dependent RNA helicase Prp11 [Schizosaccharomyces cryophilus OY26]EPY49938.1 ATP-dependent RNA helicase Prp11 [Schizosaccharomyces cryophilus OY26]